MLKAKEAVEMILASEKKVGELIDKIEQQIILSAQEGGRNINLSKLFPNEFGEFTLEEYQREPKLTVLQEKAGNVLKNHGYGFSLSAQTYAHNSTLGSMADPDDPPRILRRNWFEVRW